MDTVSIGGEEGGSGGQRARDASGVRDDSDVIVSAVVALDAQQQLSIIGLQNLIRTGNLKLWQ